VETRASRVDASTPTAGRRAAPFSSLVGDDVDDASGRRRRATLLYTSILARLISTRAASRSMFVVNTPRLRAPTQRLVARPPPPRPRVNSRPSVGSPASPDSSPLVTAPSSLGARHSSRREWSRSSSRRRPRPSRERVDRDPSRRRVVVRVRSRPRSVVDPLDPLERTNERTNERVEVV